MEGEHSRVGNMPVEIVEHRRMCRVSALVAEPIASWWSAQHPDRQSEILEAGLLLAMAADEATIGDAACAAGAVSTLPRSSDADHEDPRATFLAMQYVTMISRGGLPQVVQLARELFARCRAAALSQAGGSESALAEMEARMRPASSEPRR